MPLNVQNPHGRTALNVNDSADTTARTARLSTFTTNNGAIWDTITGLAPAAINFRISDINSPVNIATPVGLVSWIVSMDALANATGVVKDNGIPIN